MPNGKTFKVRDKQTGEVFTVRERQERQPFRFGGALARPMAGAGGELPELSRAERFKRGLRQAMPIAGQIGGGIVGGVLAAPLGPKGIAVGAALGGTAGRALGRLEERVPPERLRAYPFRSLAATAFGPIAKGITQFSVLDPEEKQNLGKEILKTGAIESIAAPIGFGISKGISALGRGVTGELLGKRVAQRGFERGFKNMLNPEFYKGRVPKLVAQKMNNFFAKLSSVTGKSTDRLIRTKYKDVSLNITDIKSNIRKLLPASGNPADLLEITASKSQRSLINELTDEVLKQKGNLRKLSSVWDLRKRIDKAIFGKRWTDDALNYLYGLRRALNNPIKAVGTDVSESFGRYAFVKSAEKDLGRNFQAITGPNKEIYARKTESFIGNVLSTKKDETLRLLTDLDELVGADDRVIENLLDVAASETLEEKFGLGLWQRMLVGLLGGKKRIAEIGAAIQEPIVQFGKRAIGRFIPTAISEGVQE